VLVPHPAKPGRSRVAARLCRRTHRLRVRQQLQPLRVRQRLPAQREPPLHRRVEQPRARLLLALALLAAAATRVLAAAAAAVALALAGGLALVGVLWVHRDEHQVTLAG
jgi:hypothetical protein